MNHPSQPSQRACCHALADDSGVSRKRYLEIIKSRSLASSGQHVGAVSQRTMNTAEPNMTVVGACVGVHENTVEFEDGLQLSPFPVFLYV
jgi:hypothetical protein